MTSNFLEKFQGKMTTITKLGPENLFKGNQNTEVYTNTVKSFTNQKLTRHHEIRHGTEEFQKP